MLICSKHAKFIKIAAGLFIATTAIFLLANFTLAANPDLGLDYAAETGLSNDQDIRVTIAKIIRIALGFLGIIALSLIIYAGWLWMTSAGNPEKIEQAKKILTNAVIGLILIFSSFAIATFILNALINGLAGGSGGPGGGGPGGNYGLSALGNGIIESHYPAREQKDVPRNTSIIITFREPMLAGTLCAPKEATPGICDGEPINQNVIRIFKKSDEAICVLGATPSTDCAPLLNSAKVYSSDDLRTFVFIPDNYLGSPTEFINYTVFLSSGLKKKSGDLAFPGIEKTYGWSFEVSNKIDLTPPQVKRGGVFPEPDKEQDILASSAAKPAAGKITVIAKPSVDQDALVVSTNKDPVEAGWSYATAAVDKNCDKSGEVKVNVDSNNKNIIRLTGGGKLLAQGQVSGQTVVFTAFCNLKLTLGNGDFAPGNLWSVAVKAATAADTITVGDMTYVSGEDFEAGPAESDTAESLSKVLSANPDLGLIIQAGEAITIAAKISGAAGNNINLSTSNAAVFKINPMAGGADNEDKVTVKGKTDQPRNSGIQIVFNEAIMPLTVSGTSDELKDFIRVVNADETAVAKGEVCAIDADCKSFICDNGTCAGDNEYLKGRFAVSNQYATVDFLSDKECGFNTCGEKIYCLPAESHLRVELKAANLIPCADDRSCADKSPFNTCDTNRKFCFDSAGRYFPQADKTKDTIVDGIIDAAFNSLDGNREGSAYGPASFYNENAAPDVNTGDSFAWSFFISKALDLTPPIIKTTIPFKDGSDVNLTNAVKISFNKLMLSSRLSTGSLIIQNGGKNILHYLLNLNSFIDQPLGYWVTSVAQQIGGIDSTDVFINHSPFSKATTYKAQAGSGLKDIYQNCFLPCSGSGVTGNPSCCNGTPYDKETCP